MSLLKQTNKNMNPKKISQYWKCLHRDGFLSFRYRSPARVYAGHHTGHLLSSQSLTPTASGTTYDDTKYCSQHNLHHRTPPPPHTSAADSKPKIQLCTRMYNVLNIFYHNHPIKMICWLSFCTRNSLIRSHKSSLFIQIKSFKPRRHLPSKAFRSTLAWF